VNARDALVTFRDSHGDLLDDTVLLHGAVLPDGRLAVRHIFAPEVHIVLEAPAGVVQSAGGHYFVNGLTVNGADIPAGGSDFAFSPWVPQTIAAIFQTAIAPVPTIMVATDPF
jgi:hypothetical protein